ncbi:hypothetical protein ABZ471_47990 [Streptomyces sp. NPDC005728]|uniref:hypothetical protein n=1 Tax=Streptomyces sp. NPDC005728 TaxID=3157054 RepID=UPI0033F10EC9
MTAPVRRPAAVGDLVRDTARGCEAMLTDVREGISNLRCRYSGGQVNPWPTTWAAVERIARRGEWEDR